MTCSKCKSQPCRCQPIPAPIVGKPFDDPRMEGQFQEIFGAKQEVQHDHE